MKKCILALSLIATSVFAQEGQQPAAEPDDIDALTLLAQVPPPPPAAPAATPSVAPVPAATPRPPRPPRPPHATTMLYGMSETVEPRAPEETLYRQGQAFLDRRRWEKAVEAFDAAANKKGAKADGALYWKAYALRKSGKMDAASATLRELESAHPKSRWLNDAKALEIEIRQAAGKPVSPDEEQDEDLKLMAIHSLAQSDPARAVPLLEKILYGSASPKLKEHALFVLSQTEQPRTREILMQVVRGKGNPDLQIKAIHILGMTKGAGPELAELYKSDTDPGVKRALLDVLAMQKDVKPLVAIARTEKDPKLKREAIQRLMMTNSKEANDLMIEILEK